MRRGIAPREKSFLSSAASGAFPFRLGGQPKVLASGCTKPFAILLRFKPGNRYHRLIGMIKVRIAPVRRWSGSRRMQKACILGVRYLARGQQKGINPYAMNRALVILPGVGAHPEPALGHANHAGLGSSRCARILLATSSLTLLEAFLYSRIRHRRFGDVQKSVGTAAYNSLDCRS